MKYVSIILTLQVCLWASLSWADTGYTYLHATCAGPINYFEVRRKDISNIEGDPKVLSTVFAKVRREASLFLIDKRAVISCSFADGTRVKLLSEPNGADARHPFPGSRVTLTINDQTVVQNVAFASDCPDRSLRAIEVDHNLDRAARLFTEKRQEGSVEFGEPPLFGRIEYSRPYDAKVDPLRIRNCYD